MAAKLTWRQIEKLYNKQWVQLVDYDWPEEEPFPRGGIVRVHAKARRKFDEFILQNPPRDSALVFVGERKGLRNTILSANLHRWQCESH